MPRGRPKKKNSNPQTAMEELINSAVAAFEEEYDDRKERNVNAPSLRSVADELETTIIRARKLLITAGMFSTELSREVQRRIKQGEAIEKIMSEKGLSKASVYSYIPYKTLAFNLDQTTVNADRHKLFRERARSVNELQDHIGLPDELDFLWNTIIAFEGYPFHTRGCRSRSGVKFTYKISRNTGASGKQYSGETVKGYGNEIKFSTKEKTVTRATVEIGYRKALAVQEKEGCVSGPKKIGYIYGASYIYPMLIRFGVIKATVE